MPQGMRRNREGTAKGRATARFQPAGGRVGHMSVILVQGQVQVSVLVEPAEAVVKRLIHFAVRFVLGFRIRLVKDSGWLAPGQSGF